MHSNQLSLTIVVVLLSAHFSPLAHSQELSILDKDETIQMEFLTKYLAAGFRERPLTADGVEITASRAVDGLTINPSSDVRRLVIRNDWAVETILRKIWEVRSRPKHEGHDIFLLVSLIVHSDRPDVLEIISSRLKNDPDFRDFISSILTHSISSAYPETPLMWYRALESENLVVRSEATKSLAEVFVDPPPSFRELWAKALVDRYGHSPTAIEMDTDPIFKAAHERNPAKAVQTRSMMLGLAEREYLRRQLPTPAVVKQ